MDVNATELIDKLIARVEQLARENERLKHKLKSQKVKPKKKA